ncbi:hypothetical protein G4B88_003257, partial [Cannabis sativa]
PKEKKNKGANSAMEHVMEQLAKSIAAKTEASLVRSESMRKYIDSREKRINEEASNITGSINMEDCQNILDGIPDLDDKRYLKALREFVANPEWRGIFLRMSEQHRRAYLDSLPKEKKNKGANSAMEHVMEQLAKSIAAKTEASLVRSESMRKYIDSREKRINEEASNITGSINMEDCQNILDGIPDLDDKRYLKALREFVANPEWRGIFLRMSEQHRRAYLDSLSE